MIECKQCGEKNDVGSLFCQKCRLYFPREIREQALKNLYIEPGANTVADINMPGSNLPSKAGKTPYNTQQRNMVWLPGMGSEHSQSSDAEGGKKTPVWIGTTLGILFVVALAAFFLLKPDDNINPNALFIFQEAEQALAENNIPVARRMYEKIIETYPQDSMANAAAEKLEALDNQSASGSKSKRNSLQDQIVVLLAKAEYAFQKGQFLRPEADNAVAYLEQVFALDAENLQALEIQGKIATVYRKQAKEAYRQKQYELARKCYEVVLKLAPGDKRSETRLAEVKKQLEK